MKKEIPMAQQEAIIRKSKEGASIRGLVKEFSAINADITMSVVRRILNQHTDTPTQQRIPSTQTIDATTQDNHQCIDADHRHNLMTQLLTHRHNAPTQQNIDTLTQI